MRPNCRSRPRRPVRGSGTSRQLVRKQQAESVRTTGTQITPANEEQEVVNIQLTSDARAVRQTARRGRADHEQPGDRRAGRFPPPQGEAVNQATGRAWRDLTTSNGEVSVQRECRAETARVFRIGKRDSYVIVAQLSPEFTARLVDRWQALEAAIPKPLQPAELSRL